MEVLEGEVVVVVVVRWWQCWWPRGSCREEQGDRVGDVPEVRQLSGVQPVRLGAVHCFVLSAAALLIPREAQLAVRRSAYPGRLGFV